MRQIIRRRRKLTCEEENYFTCNLNKSPPEEEEYYNNERRIRFTMSYLRNLSGQGGRDTELRRKGCQSKVNVKERAFTFPYWA